MVPVAAAQVCGFCSGKVAHREYVHWAYLCSNKALFLKLGAELLWWVAIIYQPPTCNLVHCCQAKLRFMYEQGRREGIMGRTNSVCSWGQKHALDLFFSPSFSKFVVGGFMLLCYGVVKAIVLDVAASIRRAYGELVRQTWGYLLAHTNCLLLVLGARDCWVPEYGRPWFPISLSISHSSSSLLFSKGKQYAQIK